MAARIRATSTTDGANDSAVGLLVDLLPVGLLVGEVPEALIDLRARPPQVKIVDVTSYTALRRANRPSLSDIRRSFGEVL